MHKEYSTVDDYDIRQLYVCRFCRRIHLNVYLLTTDYFIYSWDSAADEIIYYYVSLRCDYI